MKQLNPATKKNIIIAIILVGIPTILYFIADFQHKKHLEERANKIFSLRAKFAALAGEQHFKTKVKYFPSEFYKSLEISLGKNPLFDFTEFPEKDESGNECFETVDFSDFIYIKKYPSKELNMFKEPKYYYIKAPNKNAYIKIGNFIASDYRFLVQETASTKTNDKYFYPIAPAKEKNANKYLAYYVRDCSNSPVTNLQSALVMQKKEISPKCRDFDINKQDGYPYSLEYSINSDVTINKTEEIKKSGEEITTIESLGIAKENKSKQYTNVSKFNIKINKTSLIK